MECPKCGGYFFDPEDGCKDCDYDGKEYLVFAGRMFYRKGGKWFYSSDNESDCKPVITRELSGTLDLVFTKTYKST